MGWVCFTFTLALVVFLLAPLGYAALLSWLARRSSMNREAVGKILEGLAAALGRKPLPLPPQPPLLTTQVLQVQDAGDDPPRVIHAEPDAPGVAGGQDGDARRAQRRPRK